MGMWTQSIATYTWEASISGRSQWSGFHLFRTEIISLQINLWCSSEEQLVRHGRDLLWLLGKILQWRSWESMWTWPSWRAWKHNRRSSCRMSHCSMMTPLEKLSLEYIVQQRCPGGMWCLWRLCRNKLVGMSLPYAPRCPTHPSSSHGHNDLSSDGVLTACHCWSILEYVSQHLNAGKYTYFQLQHILWI